MVSFELPWPFESWSATLREIREGKSPHIPTLVMALEGKQPIPEEVRKFLADYMAGRVKIGRGRPARKNADDQALDDTFLRYIFMREHAQAKRIPRSDRKYEDTPYEIALRNTAKIMRGHGIHLRVDAVRKRLKLFGSKRRVMDRKSARAGHGT